MTDRLRKAITHMREIDKAIKNWPDAVIELSVSMFEARKQHPSDVAFGRYLKEQELGDYNEKDRAALISMGRLGAKSHLLREVLYNTHRRSYQHIWEEEIKPMVPSKLTESQKGLKAARNIYEPGKRYSKESIDKAAEDGDCGVHSIKRGLQLLKEASDNVIAEVEAGNIGGVDAARAIRGVEKKDQEELNLTDLKHGALGTRDRYKHDKQRRITQNLRESFGTADIQWPALRQSTVSMELPEDHRELFEKADEKMRKAIMGIAPLIQRNSGLDPETRYDWLSTLRTHVKLLNSYCDQLKKGELQQSACDVYDRRVPV